MSRIGKKPVAVPSGVTATVDGQTVKIKGPKGQLQFVVHDDVEVKLNVGTAESPREIYLNGTYQPIVNSEGKIDRIAAFVHDVTEKVKARQRIEALAEELAVSEARARRLQDSGVIGVVFWTRDGKVIVP